MMLIKLFLFFLLLLILPDVYIQGIYPPCFPKMDTLGLLASQPVPFVGNDIGLFHTRAASGIHATAQQFLVDISLLCRAQGTFRHCHPVYETLTHHLRQKTVRRICSGRIGFGLFSIRSVWSDRRKTTFSNQRGNHQFR